MMASTRAANRFIGSWVWVFPAAYSVHVAEEFFSPPTFYVWASNLVGVRFTAPRFLAVNGLFMAVAILAVILVIRGAWPAWVVLALATVLALNGLLHLLGTLLSRSYSPGLWSGLLLYVPLGAVTLTLGARRLGIAAVRRGVIAGIVIHALVPVVGLLLSTVARG